MLDIGNVLKLEAAGEEKQAGKQHVVEEGHDCDGGRELGPFYPKIETGSFVTRKTHLLSDTFVTMQNETQEMH